MSRRVGEMWESWRDTGELERCGRVGKIWKKKIDKKAKTLLNNFCFFVINNF
jgi:hypothetical protein